jgi:hypothetical protein
MFLLADSLSESRGSTPKKPKYALLTGVGCGRRMGSGKELAEGVGFELSPPCWQYNGKETK